jgi:hypothetical protein
MTTRVCSERAKAQAALYFRGSVQNRQVFDPDYFEASWSLQPHRHLSIGIRPTESNRTVVLPP